MARSLSPRLGRGFHQARADFQPEQTFVVITGDGEQNFSVGMDLKQLPQGIREKGSPDAVFDQRLGQQDRHLRQRAMHFPPVCSFAQYRRRLGENLTIQ